MKNEREAMTRAPSLRLDRLGIYAEQNATVQFYFIPIT